MSLPANEQSGGPAASIPTAADPRRARGRSCRADLVIATLIGACVLATACGCGFSGQAIAGPANRALGSGRALAFVNCMRTHGEPNVPDPVRKGNRVSIAIHPGSGVDPNSPRFAAAYNACKHLTSPGKGPSTHTLPGTSARWRLATG